MSAPGGSMCTFSRIEYSKGGEKRHWTFAETQFGPEPQPADGAAGRARAGPGGHLRERGHPGRGRLHHAADVPCSAGFEKNFVIFIVFFARNPLPNGQRIG